jgi:hypothetical protein
MAFKGISYGTLNSDSWLRGSRRGSRAWVKNAAGVETFVSLQVAKSARKRDPQIPVLI